MLKNTGIEFSNRRNTDLDSLDNVCTKTIFNYVQGFKIMIRKLPPLENQNEWIRGIFFRTYSAYHKSLYLTYHPLPIKLEVKL